MKTKSLKNDILYCKVVGTLLKRVSSQGYSYTKCIQEGISDIFFEILSTFDPLSLFMNIIVHKPNPYQSKQTYSMIQLCFEYGGYQSNFNHYDCSTLFSIYGYKKEVLGAILNDNISLFDKHNLKYALPNKDALWYVFNSTMATELLYSLEKKIVNITYEEYNKVYKLLSIENKIRRGQKTYSLSNLLNAIKKFDLNKEIALWKKMKYGKGHTSELRGKILGRIAKYLLDKNTLDYSLLRKLMLKDGTSEAYHQVFHVIRIYFDISFEKIDDKDYTTINKGLIKFTKIQTELNNIRIKLMINKSYLSQLPTNSIKLKG